MSNYDDFLKGKTSMHIQSGIDVEPIHDGLFPHQRAMVKWALRRGRAAIFADTGLGKTRMEISFADTLHKTIGRNALILAPLAVAAQTVEEGEAMGVSINHCRDDSDVRDGINIINYDRLHLIDPDRFGIVIPDESSIIKHQTGKTFATMLEMFRNTPYKLPCTATPAPNDWTELGTHAEFLGVRSATEMLAEFFVHDGGDTSEWRLKGHARKEFWRWVASWGALVRTPSDLGFDATAYDLPPLYVHQHTVRSDGKLLDGHLFATEAQTLMERREARRKSLSQRVNACAEIVNADKAPWIVWCDLNAEGDALRSAIPDAVEIRGADDSDAKEKRLIDFAHGKIRVLITKPSIAGFGLNWQHCCNMAFVGVTDSYEAYYQAVRRSWRFGQKNAVNVHIFASEQEGAVVKNLERKEKDARAMSEALSAETIEAIKENVLGFKRETNDYNTSAQIAVPNFLRIAS
jgi:hypothetical protein